MATPTPSPTASNTPTPTLTQTGTPPPTPTNTPTQTLTPTPSQTPFGVFEVNPQYQAEACVNCDNEITIQPYPHPVDWVPVGPNGQRQGTVIDLSAVVLGGINGLNN